MNFKDYLNESKVLAHVAGASGSGKTTLAKQLSKIHSDVIFKDLDEFDDEAEIILGWNNIKKDKFTDKMLKQLADKRQFLMNNFIKKSIKPIVFVGHHTEGDNIINIPTKNKFLLNIDAKTSAWRGYLRSQKTEIPNSPHQRDHRRTLKELPFDEKEAQETIDFLLKNGYEPLSQEEISQWIKGKI